ncbi:MAG: ribosome-recycling factor [Anaplasmataceae bacterium]|nr:ribosome-recycling factor [Anaplasmataceae bacterium]
MNPESLIKELNQELAQRSQNLKQELAGIRSNRPTPELLEHIKLNYYDQPMTVQQLGSISIRPPRELIVQAWDVASIPAIIKGIEDAKLGVTVSRDENVVRVSIPALTVERKEQLEKLIRKNAEEVRIGVRSVRDDYNKQLKAAESEKAITEDQLFKLKEQVQKAVDAANAEIEAIVTKKLTEIES